MKTVKNGYQNERMKYFATKVVTPSIDIHCALYKQRRKIQCLDFATNNVFFTGS